MQGNIFVISAASGTGKTTLIARLLQHHSDIRVSISHTTRAPRRGEENGKHYHFVSVPEFERMIEEGRFVEYAKVYGNYYGTRTQSLESLTRQGTDVILEIDTQGAEQIRRQLGTTILIVTHDHEIARQTDREITLHDGRVL